MAEVHIVDIDGEQWDIKDLPLTTRVANLETKTSVTAERLWSLRSSFIDKVKINDSYFLQVHFSSFHYQGSAVTQLLTLQNAIGNTEILRCQVMGDMGPSVDRISIDLDFNLDNEVIAVVLNQNIYSGGNFDITMFGDALIKII